MPGTRTSRRALHPSRPCRPSGRDGHQAPPQLLVVVNPVARYATQQVKEELDRALLGTGVGYRIVETRRGDGGRETLGREVARALKSGCQRVVAVGGDGTVAAVAESLACRRSSRIDLGVIPAGTANVLARELGIPVKLEDAVQVVVRAERSLELDAIAAGDRWVLTQVGIGPDAQMIRGTTRDKRMKLGRLAYVLAFLRRASRSRPHRFRIEVDGRPLRVHAWQILVANVGSMGTPPFTWGPGIDPTDGTLDLCVYRVRGIRDYFVLGWRLLTGRHRRDDNTIFLPIRREVRIDADRPTAAQGDGEMIGRTPFTLRVAPRAVRVLVPRAVPGAAPATPPAPVSDATAAPKTEVGRDIERMLSQRSRTWALQGPWRHPIAGLEALDAALFLRVNRMSLGAMADRALVWISRVMHYGEGWAIAVALMILVNPRAGVRAAIDTLPVLWLTMLIVNLPLKSWFRRHRPFTTFVDARVIGVKPRDFSFPSGHSAGAFAGALLLSAYEPWAAPLFYALSIVVGFSRIYLGVHYPSDVVIGALAGSFLAVAVRAALHPVLALVGAAP
jgi:YegS/Rv2252/BmrU family lipid kinase